jgi:hypothetical protein
MLWIILLFIALQPLYKYRIEDIILRAILFYMVLSIHERKQEGFQSTFDLSLLGINKGTLSLPTNINLPSIDNIVSLKDNLISSTNSLIRPTSNVMSDVSSILSQSSVNISALSPTGATGGIMKYIDAQVSSIVPTGATGPSPSSRYNAIPDTIPLTGATGPTSSPTYVATGPTRSSTYMATGSTPSPTYVTTAPNAVPLTPPPDTALSAEVITTLIVASTLTIGVIMITLIN